MFIEMASEMSPSSVGAKMYDLVLLRSYGAVTNL
jgi:hypothetical protein